MITYLEAVQTFWAVTEDLAKSEDQEEREDNQNYLAHREYADKWWAACVVNDFEPLEFLRLTKDILVPGAYNLIAHMVDQVHNMTEDQEEEGE